jgi:hypothetical protein
MLGHLTNPGSLKALYAGNAVSSYEQTHSTPPSREPTLKA